MGFNSGFKGLRKRAKCPRPRYYRPMPTKGYSFTELWAKVKQSLYMPGQALRVPGGWGSQISWQLLHKGGKVVSNSHRPLLPPRKYSMYSFLLEKFLRAVYCLHIFDKTTWTKDVASPCTVHIRECNTKKNNNQANILKWLWTLLGGFHLRHRYTTLVKYFHSKTSKVRGTSVSEQQTSL